MVIERAEDLLAEHDAEDAEFSEIPCLGMVMTERDLEYQDSLGGGLIVFSKAESVENFAEYLSQSRRVVYLAEFVRRMFNVRTGVELSPLLTEETIVNLIKIGDLYSINPMDIDCVELGGCSLEKIGDIFGKCAVLNLHNYKAVYSLGKRDDFQRDSILIGKSNGFHLYFCRDTEPSAVTRFFEHEKKLHRYLLETAFGDESETLFATARKDIMLSEIIRTCKDAGLRTVDLKQAGNKHSLVDCVPNIFGLEKAILAEFRDNEGTSTPIITPESYYSSSSYDIAVELHGNEVFRVLQPDLEEDYQNSLIKLRFKTETLMKRGTTNVLINHCSPGTGYIMMDESVLVKLGLVNENGAEDSFKPRSNLDKIVVYPAVHHWVLQKMSLAKGLEKNKKFEMVHLRRKMDHDAQVPLRVLRSEYVWNMTLDIAHNLLDSRVNIEEVVVALKEKFQFDKNILIREEGLTPESDSFDVPELLEKLKGSIVIKVFDRYEKSFMPRNLRQLLDGLNKFKRRFETIRIEATLSNLSIVQTVMAMQGYVLPLLKDMCNSDSGEIEVVDTKLSVFGYHLNLEVLYSIWWCFESPTNATMLSYSEEKKGGVLSLIVQFMNAMGHHNDKGRCLMCPYPLVDFLKDSEQKFKRIFQGNFPQMLLRIVIDGPRLFYLEGILHCLNRRLGFSEFFGAEDLLALEQVTVSMEYMRQMVTLHSPNQHSGRLSMQDKESFIVLQKEDLSALRFSLLQILPTKISCGIKLELYLMCKFCSHIGVSGLLKIHEVAHFELWSQFFSYIYDGKSASPKSYLEQLFPVRNYTYLMKRVARKKKHNKGNNSKLPQFAKEKTDHIDYDSLWNRARALSNELHPVFFGQFRPESFFKNVVVQNLTSCKDFSDEWKTFCVLLGVANIRDYAEFMYFNGTNRYTVASSRSSIVPNCKCVVGDHQLIDTCIEVLMVRGLFWRSVPVKSFDRSCGYSYKAIKEETYEKQDTRTTVPARRATTNSDSDYEPSTASSDNESKNNITLSNEGMRPGKFHCIYKHNYLDIHPVF